MKHETNYIDTFKLVLQEKTNLEDIRNSLSGKKFDNRRVKWTTQMPIVDESEFDLTTKRMGQLIDAKVVQSRSTAKNLHKLNKEGKLTPLLLSRKEKSGSSPFNSSSNMIKSILKKHGRREYYKNKKMKLLSEKELDASLKLAIVTRNRNQNQDLMSIKQAPLHYRAKSLFSSGG